MINWIWLKFKNFGTSLTIPGSSEGAKGLILFRELRSYATAKTGSNELKKNFFKLHSTKENSKRIIRQATKWEKMTLQRKDLIKGTLSKKKFKVCNTQWEGSSWKAGPKILTPHQEHTDTANKQRCFTYILPEKYKSK